MNTPRTVGGPTADEHTEHARRGKDPAERAAFFGTDAEDVDHVDVEEGRQAVTGETGQSSDQRERAERTVADQPVGHRIAIRQRLQPAEAAIGADRDCPPLHHVGGDRRAADRRDDRTFGFGQHRVGPDHE